MVVDGAKQSLNYGHCLPHGQHFFKCIIIINESLYKYPQFAGSVKIM